MQISLLDLRLGVGEGAVLAPGTRAPQGEVPAQACLVARVGQRGGGGSNRANTRPLPAGRSGRSRRSCSRVVDAMVLAGLPGVVLLDEGDEARHDHDDRVQGAGQRVPRRRGTV